MHPTAFRVAAVDSAFKKFKVSRHRVSDQVTLILKQSIMDGTFTPGDRFPPEEQIAAQLGISKVAVREALRELETDGLIEKQRGMFGGSYVAIPDLARIGTSVINCYQFGTLRQEELVEFRQLFEPVIIRTAAQRRTNQDLMALKANIDACEAAFTRGRPDVSGQIAFHLLIAKACHNELFSAVMGAVVKVFEDIARKWDLSDADIRRDLDFSLRFYDCILRRHTAKAEQLMVAHFEVTKEFIRDYRAKAVADKMEGENGTTCQRKGSVIE